MTSHFENGFSDGHRKLNRRHLVVVVAVVVVITIIVAVIFDFSTEQKTAETVIGRCEKLFRRKRSEKTNFISRTRAHCITPTRCKSRPVKFSTLYFSSFYILYFFRSTRRYIAPPLVYLNILVELPFIIFKRSSFPPPPFRSHTLTNTVNL